MITEIVAAVVVGVSLLVGVGYKYMGKSVKDDNPVEEVCEVIIKKQTGWDVDLTPGSKEDK